MSKLHVRWALPVLLAFVHPGSAAAQIPTNTLRPGDEVRVHAPTVRSSRVRGTVVLYQGSTLDVREVGSGTVVSFPLESIRALARSRGLDRGRSAWRTARFGTFIGGAGGLVAGPLIATSHAPKRFGQIMLASGVIGTLGGAGLGAILGATFPREEWQRFRMPIIPTVAAGLDGAELGLSVALP